ncbi:hypothetical protein BTO05_05505 [Winogradskyella sp. PC-19]|uniref:DUF4412 domain-containing protein n=1 Tax=unclassified Winogradskyella TaxID=2615021 RepID=UPI000B3D1A3D|nr:MULTISPECIES: DUF4412 domain-containing protein [unclassified Winogradskyella]ARV09118.1 hypothetical protein BTO05_05505 [Winogradskyella sp. PC-19]
MKKFLLFIVAVGLSLTTIAQEKFTEGEITMKQTMSSSNEDVNSMLSEIGEMITTTYVDGAKTRTESSNPMSGDVTVIIDAESNELLQLTDMPGLGKKYTSQKVEVTEEMLKNITVTEGSETKNVLGYDLKQYIITMNQDGAEMTMEMFITDKIQGVKTQQTAMLGEKVDGYPLYMVIKMNQMGAEIVIKSEVTKMEAKSIDDNKFSLTPPEGYTKM